MALKTGIEVHCQKHIRVYPVSFSFFRSMSLRSPAKKQKVAHRWLQTMDEMLAKSHKEGEVLGTCTLCDQGITVRRSKKLNYSHGRMYAWCGDTEHDSFVWLEPPSHLPRQWEKCACDDAMECREENGRPLFKCWRRNGCGAVRQVSYEPIVDHSECVPCKLTRPTANSYIGPYDVTDTSSQASACSTPRHGPHGGFVHSPHRGQRLWEDLVDVGETSQTSTGGLLPITLCQGTGAYHLITYNNVKAKATSGAIMLESVPTFELLDGKGSVEVDDFGVGSKKCRTIRLAQGIDVPKLLNPHLTIIV